MPKRHVNIPTADWKLSPWLHMMLFLAKGIETHGQGSKLDQKNPQVLVRPFPLPRASHSIFGHVCPTAKCPCSRSLRRDPPDTGTLANPLVGSEWPSLELALPAFSYGGVVSKMKAKTVQGHPPSNKHGALNLRSRLVLQKRNAARTQGNPGLIDPWLMLI